MLKLLKRIFSRSTNELYKLSDRELKDIGLYRSDIEYVSKFKGVPYHG